jgi:hypothetical protein
MSRRATLQVGLLVLVSLRADAQQSPRPYSEGAVINVQYIRVKPGRFDDYMAFLAGPYKQLREGQKKAGIITGWNVYGSPARDEQDWNVVLTTSYKNMAGLDNLDDRSDPLTKQVYGSLEKDNEAMVKRGDMREIVGDRLIRELIIK